MLVVQLECLSSLVRLEPNPELVQRFVDRVATRSSKCSRATALGGNGRLAVVRSGSSAGCFREPRPDVAEVIAAELAGSARRIAPPARRAGRARRAGPRRAGQIVEALGPGVGPALLDAIARRRRDAKESGARVVQLLCDHAELVAPALAGGLAAATRRCTASSRACSGSPVPATNVPLGKLLGSGDEQAVREALRSLARIGTPRAAALVGAQVVKGTRLGRRRRRRDALAFPGPRPTGRCASCSAAASSCSVIRRSAGRLLDRAGAERRDNLAPILQTLVPLRYRFWNPALVRVARQARRCSRPMTTAPKP